MAELWLSDRHWAASEPLPARNQPGARRVDDRRVLSGIVHVLTIDCRWQDCPAIYGPSTMIYNRFDRWARRGIWQCLLQALVTLDAADIEMTDSVTAEAHRSAAGGNVWPVPSASGLSVLA